MVISIFLYAVVIGVPPLYAMGAVYAISLLANVFFALRWLIRDPHNPRARAAGIGFILFLLCDISVGIQYFSSIGTLLPAFLYPISTYLVWLFYYPSQILLSNSSTQSHIINAIINQKEPKK
jgi:hypothetical protein